MIVISDKSLCNGCTACMSACPQQCIVMRRDREGFDYPVANPDLCRNCGKCEAVCPSSNLFTSAKPFDAGDFPSLFMELAEETINEKGVVFGALMNDDRIVGHAETDDMDTVGLMLEDNFIQSDPYGTFEEAKAYLEEGRRVLFCGTPCLIDGLNAYLGGEYENLVTLSPSCSGVASPGLWARCMAAASADRRDFAGPYYELFRRRTNLRPSCYGCHYAAVTSRCQKGREEFFKDIQSSKSPIDCMKKHLPLATRFLWLFKK